jgi:hypothetical protein
MLVSGHNYKTLLISTRIIYTKNIFTHTKKYNPCLTNKAESFREKTGELFIIFSETNLLLVQTI